MDVHLTAYLYINIWMCQLHLRCAGRLAQPQLVPGLVRNGRAGEGGGRSDAAPPVPLDPGGAADRGWALDGTPEGEASPELAAGGAPVL